MNTKSIFLILIGVIVLIGIGFFVQGKGFATKEQVVKNIPLTKSNERPQLLRFGMHVTPDPADNPINPPERFTGYHAALDLEIFEDENDKEVPVYAICKGKILQSGLVNGYGGLIVQQCKINSQDVTVLYGHLDIDSLPPIGVSYNVKQQLGKLGNANSEESGHTRKHLHLGIHKGTEIDVKGYVQEESELQNFIDPKSVLGI